MLHGKRSNYRTRKHRPKERERLVPFRVKRPTIHHRQSIPPTLDFAFISRNCPQWTASPSASTIPLSTSQSRLIDFLIGSSPDAPISSRSDLPTPYQPVFAHNGNKNVKPGFPIILNHGPQKYSKSTTSASPQRWMRGSTLAMVHACSRDLTAALS